MSGDAQLARHGDRRRDGTGTTLAATAAFGPGVWIAFLGSVAEAQNYLEKAAYPMHRMVSVYAVLRSLGTAPDTAFAVQMAVGLAAVAATIAIALKRTPQREALGLTLFLGLFVSPYACDYDLPLMGVALALLLPALNGARRRSMKRSSSSSRGARPSGDLGCRERTSISGSN